MVRNSEFGWGRYDQNKPKCSIFEPTPMNSNWIEVLQRPHFLSLACCEQLGNWPWRNSKMNYTLALYWTANEPTQGSKTDQAQKRGHGSAIRKKLGACDTPKINASVEGKNWGSTTSVSRKTLICIRLTSIPLWVTINLRKFPTLMPNVHLARLSFMLYTRISRNVSSRC